MIISQLDADTLDVEENERNIWKFYVNDLSFADFVKIEDTQEHLDEYQNYFQITGSIDLVLPSNRTTWIPSKYCAAIYDYMLECGVILPLPHLL